MLVRPNGHLLSPELGSSFGSGTGGGGGGVGGSGGGAGSVIRTGLYPRPSAATSALHYAHSTPRVNAGDLTTQPSLQAGSSPFRACQLTFAACRKQVKFKDG